MRSVIISAVLAAAAATSACSSSDSGDSDTPAGASGPAVSISAGSSSPASSASPASSVPTASGDGCQYVTTDFVGNLVGVAVKATPVKPGPPFNAPSCLYESSTVPLRQISVVVYTAEQLAAVGNQTAQSFFTAVKNSITNAKPLPGLGDEAIGSGATVYARKGGTIVYITAGVGGTSSTAVNATHEVAEKVLAQV